MKKDKISAIVSCVLCAMTLSALTGCSLPTSETADTADSETAETTSAAPEESEPEETKPAMEESVELPEDAWKFHGYAFQLPEYYYYKDEQTLNGVDTMTFYVPDESGEKIIANFAVLCENAANQNLTQQDFENGIDQIVENVVGGSSGDKLDQHTATVAGQTAAFCDISTVTNGIDCIMHYMICYDEQNKNLIAFMMSHPKDDDTYAGDLEALSKTVVRIPD